VCGFVCACIPLLATLSDESEELPVSSAPSAAAALPKERVCDPVAVLLLARSREVSFRRGVFVRHCTNSATASSPR